MTKKKLSIFWGGFFSFFFNFCIFAGLGDDIKKIEEDKAFFKSKSLNFIQKENYGVHEIQAPEYKIREYVNSNNKVFAVAWSGLTHPELKEILSSFYDEYLEVAQKQKRLYGKRFRIVKTQNLTVIFSGHLRNLKGKAFLHQAAPLGVGSYEIQ